MDYEKFKQDMEQDVLKNLANRVSTPVIKCDYSFKSGS